MHSQTVGLRVAAAVFALVCVAQLARLVLRPEILVAGHLMPLWPSVVAVVVAGALGYWMWILGLRGTKV
jgi:hypothetical protein